MLAQSQANELYKKLKKYSERLLPPEQLFEIGVPLNIDEMSLILSLLADYGMAYMPPSIDEILKGG